MRIAMIGPKRIPSREGGIDVVVGRLSSELSKLGNEVTIYVRRKKGYRPESKFNGCSIKKTFTINKKAQKLEDFISGCKHCMVSEINDNSSSVLFNFPKIILMAFNKFSGFTE